MEQEHIHKWEVLSAPNTLICKKNKCDTVITIEALLHNFAEEVKEATILELYVSQLRAKDLRKGPHERAYAYVMTKGPAIIQPPIVNGGLFQ